MNELKKQAFNGLKWTAVSTGVKTSLQLFQLAFLARFLNAEDFGLVAIIMVVVGFSQIFMDMGISNAIIYRKKISEIQLSSLYWLNIFAGTIVSFIVFIISPFVARFYNLEAITPLLQLLSITFLISSIGNQYRVLLRKHLNFSVLAKTEIFAVCASGGGAMLFAFQGYGAFSLVFGTLVNVSISNIIFLIVGLRFHKPIFIYSHKEIKCFFNFGLYQIGQKIIVYFNNQLDVLLIGKVLGAESLGVYVLMKQFLMKPSALINSVIANVSFPIMSKLQSDSFKLRQSYLKMLNYLLSVSFPIYILMIILADTLVCLSFGDKWLPTVHIFQILCVYFLVRSTTSPAGSLLLTKGRVDIGFWWSIGEFCLMPFIIYIGSFKGVVGVSIGLLVFQLLCVLPNWYFIVKKICNASFKEYFLCQFKPLISILFSSFFVFLFLNNFTLSPVINLIVFSSMTLITYIILSNWLNKIFIKEVKNIFIKRSLE